MAGKTHFTTEQISRIKQMKPWVIVRHFITAAAVKAVYQDNTRRIKSFLFLKSELFYIDR